MQWEPEVLATGPPGNCPHLSLWEKSIPFQTSPLPFHQHKSPESLKRPYFLLCVPRGSKACCGSCADSSLCREVCLSTMPPRVKFCSSLLPSDLSLLKRSLYRHSDAGSDRAGRRKFLPLQDAPLEGRQQTFLDPRGPHNLGWKLFWFFCHAGGILVPWPEIEPGPSAVKALCPNRWTAREFLFWLLKEHTMDWVDQGRYWGSGNSFNTPGFRWIQCITPRFISGLDEVFLLPGYIYMWEILPLALPSTQLLFSYPSSSRSDTLQAIFLRLSQLPLETLKNDRGG